MCTYMCLCVHRPCSYVCPWRSEVQSPGARCWEPNSGPLNHWAISLLLSNIFKNFTCTEHVQTFSGPCPLSGTPQRDLHGNCSVLHIPCGPGDVKDETESGLGAYKYSELYVRALSFPDFTLFGVFYSQPPSVTEWWVYRDAFLIKCWWTNRFIPVSVSSVRADSGEDLITITQACLPFNLYFS